MDIQSMLEQSNYFKGLTEDNRTSLSKLWKDQTVAKRDLLFFEGERGEAIFMLASGAIQLNKMSPDGKEVVIKTVEPGEVFAEVILFEQSAYPVSAVALSKSLVYRLRKGDFMHLLDNQQFRNDFTALLMRRMRYLANRILYLTSYDVDERLFLFLEEQYGKKEHYQLNLSKKDMAAAIGATPETLSRLILRLSNQGQMTWQGKTVSLKEGFWQSWEQR